VCSIAGVVAGRETEKWHSHNISVTIRVHEVSNNCWWFLWTSLFYNTYIKSTQGVLQITYSSERI